MRSLGNLTTTGNMSYGSPSYGSEVSGWYARRTYDLKDKVVEIAPQQTPFLTLLQRLRKDTTPDALFRFFEHESNWYRQREGSAVYSAAGSYDVDMTISYSGYSGYPSGTTAADQIPVRSILRCKKSDGTLYYGLVRAVSGNTVSLTTIAGTVPDSGWSTGTFTITGSGYEWGGARAADTYDDLSIRHGKTQIFKTAYSVDNTLRHSRLYGGNEMMRLRTEKAMEHKADIERALLFGSEEGTVFQIGGKTIQFTNGLYPTLSTSGKTKAMTYASSTFGDIVDLAEESFEFGSDSKVWLVGNNILSWFSKFSTDTGGGFVQMSTSQQNVMNLTAGQSQYGLNIRKLITPYGPLNLVHDPMLRGDFADISFLFDLKHLAYRPLEGRDTKLETNVQDRGTDGIIDQYLTEAGLQIENPEAHVLVTFS